MVSLISRPHTLCMWLWLEFDSVESCTKLQSNKEMAWYFTQIKHVSESFKIDERVVWIEIGGLPLNAWTPTAFKKIASSWGEPLFVDDDPSESVATGRVCIRSKIHAGDGDIRKKFMYADSEENGINTGEHDDLDANFVGVQDALDVEEGEIPAKDVAETEEVKDNGKEDHNTSPSSQNNNYTTNLNSKSPNIPCEESDSLSKPPGFEKPKYHTKHNTHHSSSSCPGVKSSRISKPVSKSFHNLVTMIEALKVVKENFQCFYGECECLTQEDIIKFLFENSSLEFKENHPGHYVVFGDFNAVRYASERIGTLFNSSSAYAFNQFIANGTLWEFPNGGHLFTRINRRGDKLSKLDRFFITEASIPHLRGAAKCLLAQRPFKFSNSWLLDSDLCTIISDFWSLNTFYGSNAIVAFKNKLKALKRIIKEWAKNRKSAISKQKDEILLLLKKYDEDTLINNGSNFSKLCSVAVWIDSPSTIEYRRAAKYFPAGQNAFQVSFESKFKKKSVDKIEVRSAFYRSIQDSQNLFLISPVSEREIHTAICDCEFFSSSIMPKGCNTSFIALIPKISNPLVVSDYRPISLIGAQYKIIAKLLANRLARVIDSVISCEQTAFVKHRQILDGPLMVNEVIKWCNRKRDKLMIFKIDFEKAFDSISWDYVLQIMKFMGFHGSWISWIRGCLNHATSSVLVNGSPTNEFHLSRGLRQGDPLSPFLFIIAMEGLHVAMRMLVLPCWCQASPPYFQSSCPSVGFNMAATTNWDFLIDKFSKRLSNWKASMLSIGGRTTLLSSVLGSIGTYYCSIFPMPSSIYKKLESLRSKFFWGSNVDGNKIPWIAWNTALASKVHGGLGIGSLFSLNQALILKWRWRFFQNPNALWVRVIKACHGGPGLDNSFLITRS
ncbi:RNA-directed DNA polymerase, eukaryota, reverse transcriptase zinc-binding domain protein [Tanacetum coccineum]